MKRHRFSGRVNGVVAGCRRDARLKSLLEKERSRISREIHDELGQSLTALKFRLFRLAKKLPDEDQSLKTMALSAVAMVDLLMTSVQNIAFRLRPPILEDLGLVQAIEWQVRQFEAATGIVCVLCLDPLPVVPAPEVAVVIFRVLQEALTNVARHAGASRVDVAIKHIDEAIVLETDDNGKGISEAALADATSLGLSGIRDRVRRLNGEVEITGKETRGTKVVARIPLRECTT